MADNNKKKPPEDAPEIKMVKPNPGQSISIQFLLLIITKIPSVQELSTDKPNASQEKTLKNDSKKGSIFDKDHFNTKQKPHNQSKREAENGNDISDDTDRTTRDGMTGVTFRRTERFKHNFVNLNAVFVWRVIVTTFAGHCYFTNDLHVTKMKLRTRFLI